jgi:hypothetical protein
MGASDGSPAAAAAPGRSWVSRVKRLVLASAMAAVILNVWTGGPLLALWLGSRVQSTATGPSMAAIAVVAVSLAAISVVLVKVLALLGRRYDDLTGHHPGPREQAPWLRSLRGERGEEHQRRVGLTTLDRILVVSVVIALAVFEVWFFFYSGSPISGGTGR